MFGEDNEVVSVQHVAQVLHVLENSQQLSIVCAVYLMGWV
jgi:hypothetical protein